MGIENWTKVDHAREDDNSNPELGLFVNKIKEFLSIDLNEEQVKILSEGVEFDAEIFLNALEAEQDNPELLEEIKKLIEEIKSASDKTKNKETLKTIKRLFDI